MNCKVIFSLLVIFSLNAQYITAQNEAPIVKNVLFSQRTDGTYLVDIYYDIYDPEGDSMTVTMKASDNAGLSWDYSCEKTTGDIGAGIISGFNFTTKHIVWDFASEHPDTCCDKYQIKIIADDGVKGCIGIETVTYEGEIYNTIQIGDQCWLKENMNVGTMLNAGTETPSDNSIIEKYCINNETDCGRSYSKRPGGYYKWSEAMKYSTNEGTQGICPDGWHIPTKAEFEILVEAVDSNADRLIQMDEVGHPWSPEVNSSGFSALLHGLYVNDHHGGETPPYCGPGGYFQSKSYYGFFWTSTLTSDGDKLKIEVMLLGRSDDIYFQGYEYYPESGSCLNFSVRCLKD